jgi:hypothetical protein
MRSSRQRSVLWLASVAGLFAFAACGERSTAASSSGGMFLSISAPKEGWAQSIEYRTGADGMPDLTIDGVRFELRDPAAYLMDWEALGLEGITTTASITYESTEPVEGAFLAVSGESVEIHDGVLSWGDAEVGAVAAGDVVVVDADGVRILYD